jgi:hypothetical protein
VLGSRNSCGRKRRKPDRFDFLPMVWMNDRLMLERDSSTVDSIMDADPLSLLPFCGRDVW